MTSVLLPRSYGATASCGCATCSASPRPAIGRRGMLAMCAGLVVESSFVGRAEAQTRLSPGDALNRLMEGNRRYVATQVTSFAEDLDILRQGTVAKQEPFAAVLSCADSRVPVELVFDQAIGHVFTTRVAGNICTPEIIASLEYGAVVLGTAAILVLGHEGCGAMSAAIAAKSVPGQISALYAPLRPAVERAGEDLTAAIKANAQMQAGLLAKASPVLADLVSQNRLEVVAGYYTLGDGVVALLS